jgi:hypothetical protein
VKETAMDLIERYIHDVARRLPQKIRTDVKKELRSALQDSLEARGLAAESGTPDSSANGTSDEQVVALLREFGPPAQLAMSYRSGPNHLIGPELYPSFTKTLTIVLSVVIGFLAVAAVVGALGEPSPLRAILKGLVFSNIFSDAVAALGWVVLVFAVIERVSPSAPGTAAVGVAGGGITSSVFDGPSSSQSDIAPTWDPRELPQLNDPDQIGVTGLLVEIVIMLGLFVLLWFFPQKIGGTVSTNDERHWVSLLGPDLLALRAWFSVGFLATVAMNLWLLRSGGWTLPTRVLELAIDLVFLLVLWSLARSGGILAVAAPDLIANGWSPTAAQSLAQEVFPILDRIMRIVFAGIGIGILVHVVIRTGKLLKRAVT